ncbi:MAG: hypothetical protein IID46_14365 [Planctomycetes bacterium]|nr:hypothetical protein [Planctomycetota bacterium]
MLKNNVKRRHRRSGGPVGARKRGLSKQHRLAHNFQQFIQSLVWRVGFTDGCVTADLHQNGVKNVHLWIAETKHPAGEPSKNYSLAEMQSVFVTRLARLMKNCNFRFGSIEIIVTDGIVCQVNFTVSVRFDKQEDLSRFFRS